MFFGVFGLLLLLECSQGSLLTESEQMFFSGGGESLLVEKESDAILYKFEEDGRSFCGFIVVDINDQMKKLNCTFLYQKRDLLLAK